MNVLMGMRTWEGIGGTQSWGRTVEVELCRRGHETWRWDALSGPPGDSRDRYDLGIFAHGQETAAGFELCDRALLVSHGIIDHERPVPGADVYAFVSEEARKQWFGSGPDAVGWLDATRMLGSQVIRQPIDCEFWSPSESAIRNMIVRPYILRYSYYRGLDWLPDVCRELGYDFHHVRDADPEVAREWIRGAACVISSGRGALEAMACGRPVVICDHRSYADRGPRWGPVASEIHANYSGRGGGAGGVPDEAVMRGAMQGAMEIPGDQYRSWVIAHHDARKITDQLLAAAGVEVTFAGPAADPMPGLEGAL